ncbi:MAG: hypothetical protein SGPRY_011967, partial [Prymnesium sp.]
GTPGFYPIIVVDDCHLRVADFSPYVSAAQTAGVEVFILELHASPSLCVERSPHGWSLASIEQMANEYEATPPELASLSLGSLDACDAAPTPASHESNTVAEPELQSIWDAADDEVDEEPLLPPPVLPPPQTGRVKGDLDRCAPD